MYTHRRSISTLLASSRTTRTRFLRLFILSILILLPALPSYIFTLINFLRPDPTTGLLLHPYSWSAVHTDWNQVMLIPAGYGTPQWDRCFWVAYGYIIFFCFGVGEDARREYRAWACAVGLGRCFSSLRKDGVEELFSSPSMSTSRGSVSSHIAQKARWFSSKSCRNMSADVDSRKVSWASSASEASQMSGKSELSGSTTYELPIVEPSHQPKKVSITSHQNRVSDKSTGSKTSKWSSFVNMPGSFAQAVAGAQNLPQRPLPSATYLSSTSSDGIMDTLTLSGSTLGGNSRVRSMEYV